MDMQRDTYAPEAMARAQAGEAELFGVVDCALQLHDGEACRDYDELLSAFRAYNLAHRAKGRVTLSVAQAIPSAVNTVILFDVVDFDTANLWDAANGRWVIEEEGVYLVGGFGSFISLPGGASIIVRLYVNNAQRMSNFVTQSAAAGQHTRYAQDLISMAAGDFVDFRMRQDTGINRNTLAGITNMGFWIAGPL